MQAGSFRKLFSCCFYSTTPSNSTPKSSSNSQKNTANSIKEPLIKENKNPLLGLSTKQKQSTKKQVNESTLNKKNICNCEFLKELNRNNELFYIENPSHYDKLLTNKKMNPERKRRLTENFKVLNCLNKYPQNKVFLLKYNSSGIFCKITYKNFKFPFVRKKNKHNTKSLLVKKVVNNPEKSNFAMGQLLMTEVVANSEEVDERLNIFSKYHQGIKIDSDCYDKILPEKVSNYLAKKVAKNGIVVDGVCGVGGNAIQFALEGHTVLAFEKADQRISFAVHNTLIYNIRHNIDIIKSSFSSYRFHNKVDLIFLAMDYENMKNSNENFCLFANIMPDIKIALENALKICTNIMLILPKHVEISELALLFADLHQQKPELVKSFSIEVECLAFNNKIEKYAVYYGDPNSISPLEEFDCLINFFNCEGERDYKSTESFIFLQDLINRFGVFEICQNLLKVQNFSSDALNKNDTLFQAFLEHLLRDNIISKNEISEYFTDDKIKDFFKRNKFQADIKEGSYTFNPNKFHSIDKSIFSNYNKSFNKMDMNPMMESPYNSIDLRDDNLTKKELAKISLNENNSFLEKDIFFCLDKENTMKKKEENPNTSHHQYISLYSDMNIDMLSENSKSDHSKSGEFEEYQENRIKFASKKTIF